MGGVQAGFMVGGGLYHWELHIEIRLAWWNKAKSPRRWRGFPPFSKGGKCHGLSPPWIRRGGAKRRGDPR